MTHPLLTKLKIACKRILGRCVYNWVYFKKQTQKILDMPKDELFSKKTRNNLITFTAKRWRACSLILICLLGSYYGIGALVSSRIDNRLNLEVKTINPQTHVLSATAFVLKKQIDNTPWTPALPAIFPAAVLDNLPNFQLGTKDAISYFLKHYTRLSPNSHLQQAKELLDYPADIWLFSQTKNDTFAPGSAKQYRKAISEIETYLTKEPLAPEALTPALDELLKLIDALLEKQISKINTYTREHSSEFLDFKADDLFYKTQGIAYAAHYILTGISKDYQNQIVAAEQYENITSALKSLADAVKLNPLFIKSSSANDSHGANHLIYLAYYLSQARVYLKDIYHAVKNTKGEVAQ